MSNRKVFKIAFASQGESYEMFAESVSQGSWFGFVEVEGILFGERSQLVVDPSEEKLKSEFKGVKRFHVPMHAVLRIDEVEKEGVSRVTKPEKGSENVANFPAPIYTPSGEPKKS
jgi:hypothetical protein